MPSGSELRRPVRRGTDQRSDDLALATGDLLERGSIVSLKRELNHEMAITRRLHRLDVRRIDARTLLVEAPPRALRDLFRDSWWG
jgi:hypothetical protein